MSSHWFCAGDDCEEHVKMGASHRSAFMVPCPESSVQSLSYVCSRSLVFWVPVNVHSEKRMVRFTWDIGTHIKQGTHGYKYGRSGTCQP